MEIMVVSAFAECNSEKDIITEVNMISRHTAVLDFLELNSAKSFPF